MNLARSIRSLLETTGSTALPLSWSLAILLLLAAAPSSALELDLGDLQATLDTTVTFGSAWRTQGRSEGLVGVESGGSNLNANFDNGNLNYDSGLTSALLDLSSELNLRYRDSGLFLRAGYFYDFENSGDEQLNSAARDQIGEGFELLDAFLYHRFDLAGRALELRAGRQVISWGESTFIVGGINSINPVDLSRARSPGVQVRQVLLPVGALWASTEVSERIGFEGFYLTEFEPLEGDECGTYFSMFDFAGDAQQCNRLLLTPSESGLALPRGADQFARDHGQFGLALRYLAEELNSTEFSLYHLHYHERLPILAIGNGFYASAYPEDIELWGVGVNGELGHSGVALQGEIAYRRNQPLQLAAGGYQRHETVQLQATATKLFGPHNLLGADGGALVGELGYFRINDFPEQPVLDTFFGLREVDQQAWGYQLLLQADYTGALGPINLSASLAFSHDVEGNVPAPLLTFLEDRKALSVGLRGSYLDRWEGGIGYTQFIGAHDIQLIHDRDFISADIKYSF